MSGVEHEAIRRLLAGVRAYRARYYERRPESMRQLVANGQKPQVLMIGCSDSRVDPAILTDAEPGEIFMVRNVANLVPPYQPDQNYHGTSAAIEYAVKMLDVRHVIVLGHARCGGIQGLIRIQEGDPPPGDFIAPWVSIAQAACDRFLSQEGTEANGEKKAPGWLQGCPHLVERAAIQGSLDNLMSFPFVRDRVEDGRLHLHGWWFDLENGDLWTVDSTNRAFAPVF
ncbi:carbonic anhydrase [Azospirillum fermentarium]|uniref:carbonic anhydrase n=1 Tax=Azospirillum fermentarium TaxID=1233114 RepID=UPI002226F396|nr:carbonic anhydrase [Azospirillum fermentarium]MCW2244533.1 carbonic anhydrase [Azospirillum fermentarium]